MLSYLPRYFNDFFQFDLKTDGLLSSLPFAGRILTGLITGYMSDWMLRRGVSVCLTRKSFQSIGCFGCAVFCLFIAFIPGLTSAVSISLLVLALSFQNITSVAFRINLLDIAPRYAGLLNGVVSTIATLISLPAPVVTSLLIAGGSRRGWMIVFCLVAAFNIIGGLIYVMFASGEIQEWATSDFVHEVRTADGESVEARAPQDISVESGLPGASVGGVQAPSTPQQDIVSAGKVKVLREVKSVPLSTSRGSRRLKERLGRRATMDVGALIKRVQSQAFSNLAFADL
ncbi:unnamed protein product [Lymnaea stagnalis]|uniref:Uncharacterized protein n=1 Tax=Lymnaea stagnalis TaxID=6523 RepID=A0AAV2HPQ5_LYMST